MIPPFSQISKDSSFFLPFFSSLIFSTVLRFLKNLPHIPFLAVSQYSIYTARIRQGNQHIIIITSNIYVYPYMYPYFQEMIFSHL